MSKKRIVISDESVNCYGTWIKTEGADISQYQRNPVLLWMHWRGCIIGCIKDIRKEGDKITGEPFFDEVREESKLAKKQWDAGTLRMCSGSFDVLELSDAVENVKLGQYRATVTKSKLTEVSMVDIGGNDNALPLKLNYNGMELNLEVGEDSTALPLLNNNKVETKEEKMDAVAIKLGLKENATMSEIFTKIDLLLGYESVNKKLQTEMETMALSAITSVVDQAVTKRLILADKKSQFIELGKKVGIEDLKSTFDSMTPVQKPIDLIRKNGVVSADASGYTKLSEVPSDEIMRLRDEDKATYMKLYRAEYGVDCPQY